MEERAGFEIHGSVHRSMTQKKYQQDAVFNTFYFHPALTTTGHHM
jgi:hypothetical protein